MIECPSGTETIDPAGAETMAIARFIIDEVWRSLRTAARAGELSPVRVLPWSPRAWDSLGVHRHVIPTLAMAVEGTQFIGIGPGEALRLGPLQPRVIPPVMWHAHPTPVAGAMLTIGLRSEGLIDFRLQTPERTIDGCVGSIPVSAEDWSTQLLDPGGCQELLARIIAAEPVEFPDNGPEHRLYEFLCKYRLTDIRANAVLASTGLGRSMASELFRRLYGMPAKQYLLRCRIAYAEKLLAQGRKPGAIWKECGFTSRLHFTKSFTRHHGIPPLRWAKAGPADKGP